MKFSGQFYAFLFCLFVSIVVFCYGITKTFVVIDEVGHIPAGIFHWENGTFELYRVNPPLARMLAVLPALLTDFAVDFRTIGDAPGRRNEWEVGIKFAKINANRYLGIVLLSRIAGLFWLILAAVILYKWGSELYGATGGCIAALVWCFDPLVMAFSQVVTPDIPAAVMGLASAYVFRRFLKTGNRRDALLAGVVLGVAQLTKFTLLIFYPMFLAEAVGRLRGMKAGILKFAVDFFLVLLVSLYVINLGYGFRGTFKKLGEYQFVCSWLAGGAIKEGARGSAGNVFRSTVFGRLPVPFPEDYVLGIDIQKKDFEEGAPIYVAGEWGNRVWRGYYLYALLVKEPLGTLALVLLSFVLTAVAHPAGRPTRANLVTKGYYIGIILFVSLSDGLNQHLRYIMPAIPFMALDLGRVSYFFKQGTRASAATIACLLLYAIGSSLLIVPHSMSYFNEAAGGPSRGHDHLLNSNIDWGQDLLFLKDWIARHPEARPIGIAFAHIIDPRPFLGIDFQLPPFSDVEDKASLQAQTGGQGLRFGIQPGYYAISVNLLRGAQTGMPDGRGNFLYPTTHEAFASFRRHKPIGMAGYSIYIYKIEYH